MSQHTGSCWVKTLMENTERQESEILVYLVFRNHDDSVAPKGGCLCTSEWGEEA